jgi:hypothetical protein
MCCLTLGRSPSVDDTPHSPPPVVLPETAQTVVADVCDESDSGDEDGEQGDLGGLVCSSPIPASTLTKMAPAPSDVSAPQPAQPVTQILSIDYLDERVCSFSSIGAERRGWFVWRGGEWFNAETPEHSQRRCAPSCSAEHLSEPKCLATSKPEGRIHFRGRSAHRIGFGLVARGD